MADNRTMAQLLEAPTEGYEDAIVVPEITADNFELKHGLLTLVQNKQFFGHDKEDPHAHIRYFNKVTSSMKFQQRFDETFYEAWDRFNDLLRACPHHGFLELHQLDTFYNALNSNDQDSLNSAAGGNFLDKMPRDCLRIIESKSKVRNSRNKPVVAKVSTSNSTPGISPDVAELKDMVKALLLDKKNQSQAPATVKAVEENCVTCGGAHSYRNCPATDGNVYRDNIQEYASQAAAVNYNQGNTSYRFDQIQPPQFPVIHQLPQEMSMEMLHTREDLMESIQNFLKKFDHISFRETPKVLTQAWDKFFEVKHAQSKEVQELLYKLLQDLQNINEELAEYIKLPSWNLPTSSYDDDDDEESSIPLRDIIMFELPPCVAITPDSPKTDSLIMVDKHLDTIPETESDEFIKSSVENLVQNPSESEDECECDVPDCDDSQTINFSTFSNPLFDDSISSDDESSHEEVIHEMSFKTYSNPLFDLDEEIISSEFNLIHNEDLDSTPKNDRFDTESYLPESLLNQDTLMASFPKVDSTLDEFAGELKTIPPGIVNRVREEYISLLERLLYDNSSPRPPEDFHVNPNMIIKSLPTFPIPVEDSDSLREEIDIFPGPDDSIPPDSTIDVVEDIPVDVPNILPTHPTLHMDFDFIPSNDLGSDHDVSSPSGDRNKIYDPGICIEVESTRFLTTLSPVIDTLLPFSSKNEDKVFNHGVLASEEKSPPSSSHRGFKAFQLISESPMMIHGENTPNLGVRHLHFYPP
ncbi:hypothetical protein Tco_0654625 [Tanacetum coccineum]|uniref:Retrotransposon gag domain-containing protein n=1 Tax=Tanacetum coccineum TaxID=301880 RepID=A0ABQ4X3T5_9ASTR